MTTTLHPAARLRRSGDGNIALGQMAHVICDEHERIARELGAQNADMWLEALCGLLGGMVEPVSTQDDDADDLPSTLRTGVPVREACRRRMPLDGADAQALEGALSMTERERDEARAEVERLRTDIAEATATLDRAFGVVWPTAAQAASAAECVGDQVRHERDRLRAEVDDLRAMLDAETRQHEETSRELDTAHAEVERLRAEVASLRERVGEPDEWEPPSGWLVRTEHRDGTRYAVWHRDGYTVTHKTEHPSIYMCDTPGDIGPAVDTLREAIEWCEAQMVSTAAPDTDESDDGWEPGPWWSKDEDDDDVVMHNDTDHAALVMKASDRYSAAAWYPGRTCGGQTFHPTRRAAIEWCEAQPEMADVIAAYNSAPTVGATDAGPDAPALIVEGDAVGSAREACAVPAAPVSPAEQLGEETGVDRPRDDERIVGPREGQTVTSRNPPYGYDVDDSGAVPVLRTVQSEAAVMLRICELLDERRNATEIAAVLNADGHRSRTGTQWTPSSVRARILGSVDEWREVAR